MKTIILKISFTDFVDDTENQFYDKGELLRVFHSDDDTIDEKTCQHKIYILLLLEFVLHKLNNMFNIYKPEDLTLSISQKI